MNRLTCQAEYFKNAQLSEKGNFELFIKLDKIKES